MIHIAAGTVKMQWTQTRNTTFRPREGARARVLVSLHFMRWLEHIHWRDGVGFFNNKFRILWTSGCTAKCEEQSSTAQSPPKFPAIPLPKKRKIPGKSWKYNAIHIHIKNYTYKVKLCVGTLSPRSLTACSRCTGSETLRSASLSIGDPVTDRGPHAKKSIFPTVVKSFLRQGTWKTTGLSGIP
jgi:hypothetical protein